MILVDSSAWIEFLRDTGSPVADAVDDMLPGDTAICEVVWMEVLAGARDEHHLEGLRGLLGRSVVLPVTPADYDEAARLYRVCRVEGVTVRKLVDCLIAAVAIREGAPILHADRDFVVLAQHTALEVHPASSG